MKNKANKRGLILSLLFCLTLGLAPFGEEPHLLGKLNWIAGGAQGMKLMDWVDLLIHGFPFMLLVFFAFRLAKGSDSSTKPSENQD